MAHAFASLLAFLRLAALGVGHSQTDLQRAENLVTCLQGRFPTLCRTEWLSPADKQKAAQAERRENLNTCLSGKFPMLCNRGELSAEEETQVAAAEKRENLSTCLTGRFTVLCNKQMLSGTELPRVAEAERVENLRTCLTGRFPSLCDHSLLSTGQEEQARDAERHTSKLIKQQGPRTLPPRAGRRSGSSGCESGHWVDSVSDDGEIVKLEDGSMWEVDGADTPDSSLWLPTTDIVVCDGRLINTEDNEKVSATQIR